MAECRFSAAAELDLEAIWHFGFQTWGLEQATHYHDKLLQTIADLAHSPTPGLACDHIRKGYRRWFFERHVIYFRKREYGILIVRILHDRMSATRRL